MGRKGCDILEVEVAPSRYAVAQAVESVGFHVKRFTFR